MAATNINRVILTGNLTRDPETALDEPGWTTVCSLRLAVNSRRKDNQSGQWIDEPNYFDVTVWGAQGENCARFLTRGRPVAIDGRLKWREWTTRTAKKRQAVEIVADSVQFLDGGGEKGGGGGGGLQLLRPAAERRPAPTCRTSSRAGAAPTAARPRRRRRHPVLAARPIARTSGGVLRAAAVGRAASRSPGAARASPTRLALLRAGRSGARSAPRPASGRRLQEVRHSGKAAQPADASAREDDQRRFRPAQAVPVLP